MAAEVCVSEVADVPNAGELQSAGTGASYALLTRRGSGMIVDGELFPFRVQVRNVRDDPHALLSPRPFVSLSCSVRLFDLNEYYVANTAAASFVSCPTDDGE